MPGKTRPLETDRVGRVTRRIAAWFVAAALHAAAEPAATELPIGGGLPFKLTVPDALSLAPVSERDPDYVLELSSEDGRVSLRAKGGRGTRSLAGMLQEFQSSLDAEFGPVEWTGGERIRIGEQTGLYREYARPAGAGRPLNILALHGTAGDHWLTLVATTEQPDQRAPLKNLLLSVSPLPAQPAPAPPSRPAEPVRLGASGYCMRPPRGWRIRHETAVSVCLAAPDEAAVLYVEFGDRAEDERALDTETLVHRRTLAFDRSPFGARIVAGTLVAAHTFATNDTVRLRRRFEPTAHATPCTALVAIVCGADVCFQFTATAPVEQAGQIDAMRACIESLRPVAAAPGAEQ